MKIVQIVFWNVVLAVLLCSCARAADAAEIKPQIVKLWPGAIPGEKSRDKESVRPSQGDGVNRITHVSTPSLTVFRTHKTSGPTAGVVICPGGSYKILAFNKEGTEVAEWLNSIGITAVVLKYRVPKNRLGAFQDAQRAVRTIRQNAAEWGIDPNRVGILGFSAGGHLAARSSTDFKNQSYPPIDEIDKLSCRPDFTVLIYPAYLYQKGGYKLVDEITVDKKTPPAFIVQTQDDRAYTSSSVAYYTALTKASVRAELHLFEKGGHGYGLRPTPNPVAVWPTLCEAWMKSAGVIKQPVAGASEKNDK